MVLLKDVYLLSIIKLNENPMDVFPVEFCPSYSVGVQIRTVFRIAKEK
jgi:hypothetical protein